MKLVHIDDSWLVVDKPAGWLTIPGRKGSQDPRPCLRAEVEKEHGAVWVVHRLDAQVSGIVVLARSAECHRVASMAFDARKVRKHYVALTAGPVASEKEQRFEDLLRKGKRRTYASPMGKPSVTFASCTGPTEQGLGWKLRPVTGRTHQLRVQLSMRGWPIVGDTLYGGAEWEHPGIALRAVKISGPFGDFSVDPSLPACPSLP